MGTVKPFEPAMTIMLEIPIEQSGFQRLPLPAPDNNRKHLFFMSPEQARASIIYSSICSSDFNSK
ncbi:hypothetical protein [Bartonella choladocola]|uniref:hypothetical protein n=1 Tax=Bartonella choladocola TaxID=2750995 RepID=UPI00122E0B44|nr:hypothetical protein [Bartonella choladocola]